MRVPTAPSRWSLSLPASPRPCPSTGSASRSSSASRCESTLRSLTRATTLWLRVRGPRRSRSTPSLWVRQTEYGANSAIITTSGTTLGGIYTLTVVDVIDHAGNLIQDGDPGSNEATLITRGSIPNLAVSSISGTELLLDFDQDLLTEIENPDGVDDETEYGVSTSYPIVPIIESAAHQVDLSQVVLTVSGQTSTAYDIVVGDADAIVYDASVLPSADPGFSGTEVGLGTSTLGTSTLLLSKASGDTYGWNFAESPNDKILPNSSFRAQFSIGQSQSTFDPALTDGVTAFAAHISDGSIQVSLNFLRSGGLEIIRVLSGTLSQDVTVNWSGTSHDIALVRNEFADSYTVVVDDTPILTVPATGVGSPDGPAIIPPGIQIVLGSGYEVTDFPLTGIQFDSSQTLYTSAWNFIHGLTSPFTGIASLALDKIHTQYGPLVKDWGDPTLATPADVEVRINGTPVSVSDVNPYTGEITTTIPIPRTAAGTNTVEVDYAWFPNPILPMAGLNTPGLILNKYDRKWGRNTTTPGNPVNGTRDFARFPYAVVLGPEPQPCEPVHIGHRFIGFEQDYTASLNSPNYAAPQPASVRCLQAVHGRRHRGGVYHTDLRLASCRVGSARHGNSGREHDLVPSHGLRRRERLRYRTSGRPLHRPCPSADGDSTGDRQLHG